MTFADDLKFAQTAGMAVELTTYNGQQFGYVGVEAVNAEEGWVSLWTPEHSDDETTRTRLELSNISSVKVSDIAW